jgi:hypothetical protein
MSVYKLSYISTTHMRIHLDQSIESIASTKSSGLVKHALSNSFTEEKKKERTEGMKRGRESFLDTYDPEYANRFWRVLLQSDRVFKMFRARSVGKCSPGALLLGRSRLGRHTILRPFAPPHPGGVSNLPDRVAREAYSHEVSSCGFGPGGGAVAYPAYYSYAYPEPEGFVNAPIKRASAFYSTDQSPPKNHKSPHLSRSQFSLEDANLGEMADTREGIGAVEKTAVGGHQWAIQLDSECEKGSVVKRQGELFANAYRATKKGCCWRGDDER